MKRSTTGTVFAWVCGALLSTGTLVVTAPQDPVDPGIALTLSPTFRDHEYTPAGDDRTQLVYLGDPVAVVIAIRNRTNYPASIRSTNRWFDDLAISIGLPLVAEPRRGGESQSFTAIPKERWRVVHRRAVSDGEPTDELILPAKSTDVATVQFDDRFSRGLGAGVFVLRVTCAARLNTTSTVADRVLDATVKLQVIDPESSPTHRMEYCAQRANDALRARHLAEARAWATRLVAANPVSVLGLTWLGDVARLQGDCARASQYHAAALASLEGKQDRASLMRDSEQAIQARASLLRAKLVKCP